MGWQSFAGKGAKTAEKSRFFYLFAKFFVFHKKIRRGYGVFALTQWRVYAVPFVLHAPILLLLKENGKWPKNENCCSDCASSLCITCLQFQRNCSCCIEEDEWNGMAQVVEEDEVNVEIDDDWCQIEMHLYKSRIR